MTDALRPMNLRCQHLCDPLAIDEPSPSLSWLLSGGGRNRLQTAYRIIVSSSQEGIRHLKGDLWDSEKVNSDETLDVRYRGKALESRQPCFWAVCIWDEKSRECWSEPAVWEMGILDKQQWVANWIGGPVTFQNGTDAPGSRESNGNALPMVSAIGSTPIFYLRKSFEIDRSVVKARLYATARGVYRAIINDLNADDRSFAPGWSDYNKRIEYQCYDVTQNLTQGTNTLCAMLGEGWYAGFVGPFERRRANHYGLRAFFIAQLVIEFEDGEQLVIKTDQSWRAHLGPVSHSDFLLGELHDGRKELVDWSKSSYDDAHWYQPIVDFPNAVNLVAEKAQPIRVVEELNPVDVTQTQEGGFLFDLGENMVGRVRFKTHGSEGQRITLRHGEALDKNGALYTENLRFAKSEDTYILTGSGEEIYEPLFTYHGFRYVEVSGLTHSIKPDTVTGLVLMTDTPETGEFSCSNPLVNQLQKNILRSQKGNFLSIPTDCPQRDERLGWLGDAEVFARTAAYNMDVSAFFSKWMDDVTDAQLGDGQYTDTAPCIIFGTGGAPGWAEAGVIVPWTMYLMYGDKSIIERNWDAMTKWMDFLRRTNPDHIRTLCLNMNFGDWLAPDPNTPKPLVATAFYARCADLMARMATALERSDEAEAYQFLFQKIARAFQEEFVDPQSRVAGDTQTSYLLALGFNLIPKDKRAAAGQYLVADIKARDWHLSSGFLGINLLLPVLCDIGHTDTAFRILLNEDYPSWGYCIKHGATSIWERWDSWTPENGFQEIMNSFNHYAYGSVGEWFYRYLAGIDTYEDSSAFKEISIDPHLGGGLTSAQATYLSCRGPIKSAWRLTEHQFELDVVIPPNTSAVVALPPHEGGSLTEGGIKIEGIPEIEMLRQDEREIRLKTPSGTFNFSMTLLP